MVKWSMDKWTNGQMVKGSNGQMGSHHPLGGSTGPGWKILWWKNFRVKNKTNLAFHPGPVKPPSGEGSPLTPSGQKAKFVFCFLRAKAIRETWKSRKGGELGICKSTFSPLACDPSAISFPVIPNRLDSIFLQSSRVSSLKSFSVSKQTQRNTPRR